MNTITKKLTSVMTALLVGATIFGFVALPAANALTVDQINAIVGLLSSFGASSAVIADVTAALNGQPTSGGGTGGSGSCATYGTSSIVRVGSLNSENVLAIQKAMNQILTISGGTMAPLVEDGLFGPLTKGVVQYFQGIIVTPQDGVWGPNTQAAYVTYVANHCNPTPVPPVPPVTGAATASLSPLTPATGIIATGGNANVTRFTLTGGSAGLTVNSITTTRMGLSNNSDYQNIKITDADGVNLGNTVAGPNSNSQAKVSFTPALSIGAGVSKDFFIRVGAKTTATTGSQVKFGINAATDIVGSAVVGGTFPIVGNGFNVTGVTIGTLTMTSDGTVSDNQPEVGDTNVIVNQFKLSAGTTEDVTVDQIQVEQGGTASLNDTANIELWDVTHNVSLGTVASWNSQGFATFNNLNLVIAKGGNVRFKVLVDFVGGTGYTFYADVVDGGTSGDPRVIARGNNFGFFITPTTSSYNGQGTTQNIQSGALTVTKSGTSPATGNITKGDNRLLGVFDFTNNGEPAQITQVKVQFTETEASGSDLDMASTTTSDDITNAIIRDMATGTILGGPNSVVGTAADIGDATFTDVFDLPVGVTKIGVYASLGTSFAASDTIVVAMKTPGASVTAKGLNSNNTITATPSTSVSANTLTVKAATLTATTLTSPSARSVAKGSQDYLWAKASLSAANSGEDVDVTAMTIEATLGDAADDANSLDNFEIWADLTSASSTRGDVYETQVSQTKQFTDTAATDETVDFTLTQSIRVAKNGSVGIAVIGDLSTSGTTGDTFAVSLDTDSGDVTANGVDTGDTVTFTPSGGGQVMTVTGAGELVISVNSSSPVAKVVLDGNQGGKETLGVFKLLASNVEDMELDSFMITDGGSDSAVETYYFQAMNSSGGTAIGSEVEVVGGATATAYFADGQVTIPANGYILMVVKGKMADIASSAADNESTVQITVADVSDDVDANSDAAATGLASGSIIYGFDDLLANTIGDDDADESDETLAAASHYVFQSYPTFAWQTLSTTALTGNANQLIGKLKITNVGNKDVSFLSGSTSNIIFQFTQVQSDSDDASAAETVTYKDDQGNTLDTTTVADGSATVEGTVNFSTTALTIPVGSYKTIYAYMDTSDLETDGDSIQMSLDNTTVSDLSWAIDGSGDYDAEAGILWGTSFMADAYAQLLINPA